MKYSYTIPDRAQFRGFARVRTTWPGILNAVLVFVGEVIMAWGTVRWPVVPVVAGWSLWSLVVTTELFWANGPRMRRWGLGGWNRADGAVQWHAGTESFSGPIIKIEDGNPRVKWASRALFPVMMGATVFFGWGHGPWSSVDLWVMANMLVVGLSNWTVPVHQWVIHVQGPRGRARLYVVQMDNADPTDGGFLATRPTIGP